MAKETTEKFLSQRNMAASRSPAEYEYSIIVSSVVRDEILCL